MESISVIVPVFQGKNYIGDMIAQLEQCADVGNNRYLLELIFVNDDPVEQIGFLHSEKIKVRVLETDVNRGIHGARIRGLEHCAGDYVLFLDQDDRIASDYFIKQMAHLGDGDAVVCKLLHEGRQFYDTRMPFEEVITREFILSVRNPIISPGQVLLRKEKIPASWKNVQLKNNGADDWLLWLCMLAENSKFVLNPEILFEHVVEGGNESINTVHMLASEQEIYEALASMQTLVPEDLNKLKGAVQAAAEGHIRLLSKFQKMFFVYDQWLKLQEEGRYIHEYLRRCGVCRVAIYGDSYIGKRLYHSLKGSGVEIRYFIDRNAAYLEEEIPVYPPQEGLPPVDLIIICLVEGTDEIKRVLSDLSGAKRCTVMELFADMGRVV